MGKYYLINGHKLYVEIFGDPQKEPILYIHGKPGIGVIDLMEFQKENFKNEFFIIAPEQYGVWRSESIEETKQWGIEQIIEDYEIIRKKLNIKSWNVLTHCIGSFCAMKYVQRYGCYVKKVIFESPIIDVMESNKSIIKYQLELISELKGYKVSKNYLEQIKKISTIRDLKKFMLELQEEVGESKNSFIMYSGTMSRINNIKCMDGNYKKYHKNSYITGERLCNEYYSFFWQQYVENLKSHKCLILVGRQDTMVNITILKDFIMRLGNSCECHYIDECKHWIKIDQPEIYSHIIRAFIGRIK